MKTRYLGILCLLSIVICLNGYATNKKLICPRHLKGYIHNLMLNKKDIQDQQYVFHTNKFNEQGISFTGKIQLDAANKKKAIRLAKNLVITANFRKNLSIAKQACIYKSKNHPHYSIIVKKQ